MGSLIPVADKVRILHFLSEHGSSHLMDVAQAATASRDAIATILALCCSWLLEIDDD